MKTLRIDVDLTDLNFIGDHKDKSAQQIFYEQLKIMCISYMGNQRGGTYDERRIYDKVCDDIEKAIKEGKVSVDLEDDRVDFIKKCVKSKFVPTDIMRRVEQSIINDLMS